MSYSWDVHDLQHFFARKAWVDRFKIRLARLRDRNLVNRGDLR